MKGLLAILVLGAAFIAPAELLACSCIFQCSGTIAVGDELPVNARSIGVSRCSGPTVDEHDIKLQRLATESLDSERTDIEFSIIDEDPKWFVVPAESWSEGEWYVLKNGSEEVKFVIGPPLELEEVVIEPRLKDLGNGSQSVPGGTSCSWSVRGRLYEVSLELPPELEQYRKLIMVRQYVDDEPHNYRSSSCDMSSWNEVLRDGTYEFMFPESDTDSWKKWGPACPPIQTRFDASIAGLDIPVRVKQLEPFGECPRPIPWTLLFILGIVTAIVFLVRSMFFSKKKRHPPS